ncbi:dehydroascorbate reductase 2 [Tanacetum coccineum]
MLNESQTGAKQSSTGEAIMICIDTSRWIKSTESPMFEDQANAIELYYTEKLKSHPETFEGICGMGDRCITHLCKPTRELSEIIGSLYAARIGGYLLLLDAVMEAHGVWFSHSGKKLGGHLPKRIGVFAEGFGDPAENKHELFDTLIAVADKNGNCNVLHVPPESSVCDSLLRSQIIRSGSAPLVSLLVQQESYSVADNTDALALSRSLIIPHVGVSDSLASLSV